MVGETDSINVPHVAALAKVNTSYRTQTDTADTKTTEEEAQSPWNDVGSKNDGDGEESNEPNQEERPPGVVGTGDYE